MVSNTLNKRIVIFAGHYGSGKTNIAVNHALYLKKNGFSKTVIADLDIVNPYYRTKDAADIFIKNEIRLISPEYASSNVDLPALPAEAYAIIDDKTVKAVIDLGGDDRGALAMGRYREAILKENSYEMFFVLNAFRPLTKTVDDAISVLKEIEDASKMKFTAIINNSNLGDITTKNDVLSSIDFAKELSERTNLKIAMTTVKDTIFDEVKNEVENAVPISLYIKQSF